MTNRKLGKKLGVVHDRRTLQVTDVTDFSKVHAPTHHGVASHLEEFPVFLNDQIGDCTVASNAHRIVGQERSASQRELPLTDEDVLKAYEAVSGYRPDDPSTDNGAYLLDVCNYLRKTGIGRQKDGSPHTVAAFAQVDPKDHDTLKRASYLFGGLYCGVGLPVAAEGQLDSRLWELTGTDEDEFGSWGGHAMWAPRYFSDGYGFVTWGQRQNCTLEWWEKYVDEVYALISPDFVRRGGETPQGFNVEALERFLKQL